MHICFIGEFPHQQQPIGGISVFLQLMARELTALGHRVTILSFSSNVQGWEQRTPFGLYRIHPYQSVAFNFWRIARAQNRFLQKLHREHPIDVVEVAESGLCFLKKIEGVRYVIRLHGGHLFFSQQLQRPIKWWLAWQEKRSFAKADAIAGVSRFVLQQTKSYIPAHVPCSVIFNPVDTDRFSPASPPEPNRTKLVFVGWLTEKKGIRQLIVAFGFLQKKHPWLSLHCYGSDTQTADGGSYKKMLEDMIAELGISQVHFHGIVANAELPAIINEALCCVYPSQMEAMPVAWLEVISCGQILVGGNTGPAAEIITDKKNGLLCNPYDPLSIAAAVDWLILHPEESDEIRRKARESALSLFSIGHIIQQNIHFWTGRAK
jgi:glycosyltransferase involved in cell wall biosynthesis